MQVIAYDGGGSRILKQRELKAHGQSDWIVDNTTHYSGIGTELRVDKDFNKKVVVNMPQGMGRYGIEELECSGETCQRKQGTTNVALDEFYLKNHLGSTVAVMDNGAVSTLKAAYDYRAFGEQVDLEQKGDKVTENFTGKEKDDETELNYFGARYLDPMLGLWISVDAARQYQNPYLYAGNNPIMRTDPDGNQDATALGWNIFVREQEANFRGAASKLVDKSEEYGNKALEFAKDEGVDIALVTLAVIQPELAPLCADALLVKGVAQGIMNDSPGQVLTSTVGFFIPGVNSVGKALGIYAVEKIVNETVVNPFLDENFETKNIDMQKNYNDYAE